MITVLEPAAYPHLIDLLFKAFIESYPCAVLLILIAAWREVCILVSPSLAWRQLLDFLLKQLGIVDFNLDSLVVKEVAPKDVEVKIDIQKGK